MVDKSMVTLLQSAPHTQARADKIVAAWDQYLADMRTAREKSRFEEADEAAREAVAELHELEGRIVRTRAKTPTGNARKGADGGAGSRNGVNGGRPGTRPRGEIGNGPHHRPFAHPRRVGPARRRCVGSNEPFTPCCYIEPSLRCVSGRGNRKPRSALPRAGFLRGVPYMIRMDIRALLLLLALCRI